METNKTDFGVDTVEELFRKRIIPVFGEINKGLADRVTESLIALNARSEDPITTHIRSTGGGIDSGFAIYDAFRLSKAKVTGIVWGVANSAASVLLQGCHRRQATHHSTIFIHNLSGNVQIKMLEPDDASPYGRIDIDGIVRAWNSAVSSQLSIIKIYSERSLKSPKAVIDAMNADRPMTAIDALRFGLIDEVI